MPRKRKKDNGDESDTNDNTTTATRPDVSKRLSARKLLVETCHKSSLGARLGPNWNKQHRDVLFDTLKVQVQSTSEITFRGSFIVNSVVLVCLQTNSYPELNQSFFNACFVEGLQRFSKKKSRNDYSLIQDVVANEFYDWPTIERCRGDIQVITIAAKRYLTNFKTSLKTHFLDRQRTFISAWLKHSEIDDVSVYDVQCHINGWKQITRRRKRDQAPPPAIPFPEEVKRFVEAERRLLGDPDKLSAESVILKNNVWTSIRYLHHILEFYDQHKIGKGFSLAPLADIKSHHITVDTTVLFELLKNVKKSLGDTAPTWMNPLASLPLKQVFHHPFKDVMWHETFNLDGLRRGRRFNYQVDTNGVVMTSHFVFTKKKQTRRAKRRRHKAKSKSNQRVISIDPGRTNLITAHDSYSGTYSTLSRAGYRQAVGFDAVAKTTTLRELPLRGMNHSLSKGSMRTCNPLKMYVYRQVVIRNYALLWSIKTSANRARGQYTIYRRKTKVLDRFFAGLVKKGEPKPVVAYGAATIQPNGQGEISVPVKGVLKVCRRHYSTVMVNEHLSSKKHHACGCRMHPVGFQGSVSRHSVRGLFWCPTCKKFVNRDRNACLNIEAVFLSEERPAYLAFGQPAEKMRRLDLLPPKRVKETKLVAVRHFKNECVSNSVERRIRGSPLGRRPSVVNGDTITRG